MSDFLTEKLMLNSQHGMDCTVEVCNPGYPDNDELIFRGSAGDCLRYIKEYELSMNGGSYFSFTSNQDNYCGYNFEEIAYRMGFSPERLEQIIGCSMSVSELISDAADRAGGTKETASEREMDI